MNPQKELALNSMRLRFKNLLLAPFVNIIIRS
jgi:hypothetical protein